MTVPDSVTSIGQLAFLGCVNLNNIVIGQNVTSIGQWAFQICPNLTGVYFKGEPPYLPFQDIFAGDDGAIVYYLPSAKNWGSSFGGRTTVLWNPHVRNDANFGVRDDCFGFTFTNGGNPIVVVEACTNLVSPDWSVLATNTLTGGSSYFSDPQWTNSPARFYGFRMP